MKPLLFVTLLSLFIIGYVHCSVSVSVVQTSKSGDRLTAKQPIYFEQKVTKDAPVIKIDKSVAYQSMIGFGGALTEAAAYVLSGMKPEIQRQVLEAYYSPSGLNYTLGRVHMNSCDFSLNSYSCDDVEGDYDLVHFNINRDRKYLLPLVQAALNVTRYFNPHKQLQLFLTPWSPPYWMKSNHNMNGSFVPGLIDNPKIHASWALHYSKFVTAYKQEGVDFWGLTVQNEPEFAAPWDACVYRAEDQRDFIKDFLGPRLRQDHPYLKLMIFDHNRDDVLKFAKPILTDPEAAQYVDGVAFHWYSSGDYQNVLAVHENFPDRFVLATEACHCPGVILNDWDRGEAYGFDIINDINNYAAGWVDWNIVLDTQGGPNHLKNYCDAPIILDASTQTVHYQVMYYFLGHFSKYVFPGSVRINVVFDESKLPGVIATGFLTPANTVVVIVMNQSEKDQEISLQDVIYSQSAATTIPKRSIRTFVYTAP